MLIFDFVGEYFRIGRLGSKCRDIADTQYIHNNTKISKTVNLMYYSSLCVSWPKRLLVARKSIMKVPNQKVTNGQNVFLSSFSSSDGLVRNCMTLSQLFPCKTSAFYTEQCIPFKSHEVLQLLKNCSFICDVVHTCTIKIAEFEMETVCHPLLIQYLNRCLINGSSANTAYI